MTEPTAAGTLYVVGTPVGNLEDMSLRALRILREVDLIACEDTRVARRMLVRHGIATATTSYFEHNKHAKGRHLLGLLERGGQVALVTDAGTPGISDPGADLVRLAREAGIRVVPIPGPSAVATLLSACGLPADRFVFAGFLPVKSGRRQTRLRELQALDWPIVLYESCHRIRRTLDDLKTAWGDRHVVVGRELTKLYEEIFGGRISEVRDRPSIVNARGEFVVVVAPRGRETAPAAEAVAVGSEDDDEE
ncbi:MAG TPA: 16S rRNA (cytidine(1402)-2'-O)-methyltransferase [Methylomirabilota bacterium]|jgi:16S rRNA (cytidine1402-2'-O)-methyltransferase